MPATRNPIIVRDSTPGKDYVTRYIIPIGTTVTSLNGLRSWESRSYTSYLGQKVYPLVENPHAYYINKQKVDLRREYRYESYSGGKLTVLQTGEGPGLSSVFGGITSMTPSYDWAPVANEALGKLNENMRGAMDLSISAFQARQTAQLFRPITRVLHYTEKFTRALTRKSWREFISGVSEARLEYQYGLKPLMSDVYGVLHQDPLMTSEGTMQIRGSAGDLTYKPTRALINSSVGNVNFYLTEVRYLTKVKYQIAVRTANQDTSRWTSMNPASILWELMPYSFVVDWFYDVGGYLRSVETGLLNRSNFVRGHQTKYVKGSGSIYWTDGFWFGGFETIDITRTLLSSYPLPYAPSLKVNMGAGRLFNAAALLGVMLRDPRPPRYQGRKVRTINGTEYRKPRYFSSKSWKDKYTEWSKD